MSQRACLSALAHALDQLGLAIGSTTHAGGEQDDACHRVAQRLMQLHADLVLLAPTLSAVATAATCRRTPESLALQAACGRLVSEAHG